MRKLPPRRAQALPPRADVAAVPPHTGQNLPMLFLDLNRVKNLPITAVWEDFFSKFFRERKHKCRKFSTAAQK